MVGNEPIEISCDASKRARTLEERGLDFFDAAIVFSGRVLTLADVRRDYGEERFQSYGLLRGRFVQVVWTRRGSFRHVISMRYCHDREIEKIGRRLGRSG